MCGGVRCRCHDLLLKLKLTELDSTGPKSRSCNLRWTEEARRRIMDTDIRLYDGNQSECNVIYRHAIASF